ncbi:aldehyde dehydrogenase family protein [Mycolicibacterium xanthum]|uniref:aldehyde dehydrogenase family protein n=1 Tax=Mycolicibacterium xanthum TaxID=2796469 RepID=UPI003558493A
MGRGNGSAREEIFGAIMVVMNYEDIDDTVRVANDTPDSLYSPTPSWVGKSRMFGSSWNHSRMACS